MQDINDLISAVREGRLESARELISSFGPSYSPAWSDGYVLLCEALENKHAEVAKLLLTNGSNVNTSIKPSDTPLHFAVINGDIEIVKMILEKGANIEAENRNGRTPLYDAIENKKIEVTEFLLKYKARVNDRANDGTSPLHVATEIGCLQIIEHLLKYGADINCVCTSTSSWKKGYAPLHCAVENGSKEVVTLLLCRGANVDVKAEDSITPLHITANKGYICIAEDLLNHGACAHSLTLKEGYMPLHFASELGNEEAVKLFLNRGADINASTKGNLTPLSIATKEGHNTVVKLLLEYEAKLDYRNDDDGKTILHLAVENAPFQSCSKSAYFTIVKLLLQHGAKVDNEDADGKTVLYLAVKNENFEIVKLLLQHGANVDTEGEDGKTALHLAVENGNIEIVKWLLLHGAVDNDDEHINTALHLAVGSGNIEIVKMLLHDGATVDDQDEDGKIALHLAVENGNIQIVKLLLQHGEVDTEDEVGNTALHLAVENGNIEIVKLLLQFGAKVENQDKDGKTALHLAVENGNIEILKLLLQHGAKVGNTYENGDSALHLAIDNGNIEMVKLLLQHGEVDTEHEDGNTALHIAVGYENIEMIKLLLQLGAKVDNKDKDGSTALHLAVGTRNIEIVKLLLQDGAKVDKEDEDGKTALYHAVSNGCLMVVEEVLKYFPDINNKSNRSCLGIIRGWFGVVVCAEIVEALRKYGFIVKPEDADNPKLLHAAVENGHLKIIEDLLKYGADVNMLFKSFTPLHTAAKKRQEEVAKLLISCEADINARDRTGKTPIFYAIENADSKITKLLLTNRANIKDGPELLNPAVKNECIEIVEALLQLGVDVNARDEYGKTPIVYAIENADSKITKLLLTNGANIKDSPELLNTAVKKQCMEIVEALLQHDADVNASDEYGRTALHYTAFRQSFRYLTNYNIEEEIAKLLLSKGANADAQTKNGETILHTAVENGCKEVVKVLLECGAKVDSKMKNDFTLLHLGAEKGYHLIIETLLKFGADIDSKDEYGRTALHIASEEGHLEVVETLLEYGSDINITCRSNQTALDYAMDGIESFCNSITSCSDSDDDYDYFDPNEVCPSELTAEALKRHIVKIKTANLYLSKENLLSLRSSYDIDLGNFRKKCKKEIVRMKNEEINARISFYDIFAKDTISLEMYLRNENTVQVLKSEDYKTKFPKYASMIGSHFRKAMKRKELLEQSYKFFHFLVNNFPELPYDCTEKIFIYLCNKDLQIFVDACKPLSIHNPNTND